MSVWVAFLIYLQFAYLSLFLPPFLNIVFLNKMSVLYFRSIKTCLCFDCSLVTFEFMITHPFTHLNLWQIIAVNSLSTSIDAWVKIGVLSASMTIWYAWMPAHKNKHTRTQARTDILKIKCRNKVIGRMFGLLTFLSIFTFSVSSSVSLFPSLLPYE